MRPVFQSYFMGDIESLCLMKTWFSIDSYTVEDFPSLRTGPLSFLLCSELIYLLASGLPGPDADLNCNINVHNISLRPDIGHPHECRNCIP